MSSGLGFTERESLDIVTLVSLLALGRLGVQENSSSEPMLDPEGEEWDMSGTRVEMWEVEEWAS